MTAIPTCLTATPREEWPDADFDFLDGSPIHASDLDSDKPDDFDMDWDAEMDLGKTGGARAKAVVDGLVARSESSKGSSMITIRPPLSTTDEEDEDEEGVSTIKVAALPTPRPKSTHTPPAITEDDDMEDAFSLPSEMTQLSLRPLSLHHQSSKGSLEWGDNQTSSSQSSDAYSNLGLHDGSASSTYTSASLPETETDDDDEGEGVLDGLVIPNGLFDVGVKNLKRILEIKKTQIVEDRAKASHPNADDDFEIGLVIGDDFDLSPSRLLLATQQSKRANAIPTPGRSAQGRPPSSFRPPSRVKGDRAKSPNNNANPPTSSMRQFRSIAQAVNPQTRATNYGQPLAGSPSPSGSSLLAAKPGSLRGQKSHSGLNPSPPSSQRRLGRKASLPSFQDPSQAQASGSGPIVVSRYEAPTASSRAKMQSHTTSKAHGLDYAVGPTRPSTPSSNPVALRLTMPTNLKLKSRTPISSVFPNRPPSRSNSPQLPRPPSTTSLSSRSQTVPSPPTVKVLKKSKRQRTYGDGTELDGFDDLPLDGEKETRYRVQPKNTRVPGASYPKLAEKDLNKDALRRKSKRDLSVPKAPSVTNTLRRKGHIDTNNSKPANDDTFVKKRKPQNSPVSRRKPHLIRNLGGTTVPKVVGEMRWNPQTLRWEGNDQALRDFDVAVGTSTRPALITHLTGSSIGSPVGSLASGARIVGNMIFDPSRMCWISTLAPEDDEPDVFADLADDEEECDSWETKGGTIRPNQPNNDSQAPSETSCSVSSSRMETPSPARSRKSHSDSDSDRGSRASLVYDVDESFAVFCQKAEERHRTELKGWRLRHGDMFDVPDRSHLWEIRALATRRY